MNRILIKTILVMITGGLLASCVSKNEHEPITRSEDYNALLTMDNALFSERKSNLEKEAHFWKTKISQVPQGFLYVQKLARAHEQLFDLTGDVSHLWHVDSLFHIASELTTGKWQTANMVALTSNAIKQHEFGNSLTFGRLALESTDQKFGPLMMVFDAYMELGHYESAYSILNNNKRLDSFDYLVRLSKYQDHVGDLDSAITLMETAYDLVKFKSKQTKLWAMTNLGDMYGHAGRLQEAYDKYLEVLSENADYRHALKGVAWLAYSHDNNIASARKIINAIQRRTQLPDTYLLLAEMAEYEGDLKEKDKRLEMFVKEASKRKYGPMYNKYLIEIWLDQEQYDKAIELAEQEIKHRSTPLTNSLLAWCYEKSGNHQKALQMVKDKVIGKTFEPEILYHAGVIYLSSGELDKGIELLREAEEASFELGPVMANEIQRQLSSYI